MHSLGQRHTSGMERGASRSLQLSKEVVSMQMNAEDVQCTEEEDIQESEQKVAALQTQIQESEERAECQQCWLTKNLDEFHADAVTWHPVAAESSQSQSK